MAIFCEELKVEWLSGGRDNQRDSGLWIFWALPKQVLQEVCEQTCGAIRLAPLDSFHILFSPYRCQQVRRCVKTVFSCDIQSVRTIVGSNTLSGFHFTLNLVTTRRGILFSWGLHKQNVMPSNLCFRGCLDTILSITVQKW